MATQPYVDRDGFVDRGADGVSKYVDESSFERVDGDLLSRPVPGLIHAKIQKKLLFVLSQQEQEREVLQEWSVARPETLLSNERDYLTPDVLVAAKPYRSTKNGHLIPPGLLAVEVVSPGQDELFRKALLYGAWGIEHVWIINPQTRECFEYHGGDQFTLAGDTLRAGGLSVRLAEVFADLPEGTLAE